MSNNSLPPSLFDSLTTKLLHILELSQMADGAATPQARQTLLQATNDFKNTIQQAKDLAEKLPGGELVLEDQDQVIAMLEDLRDRKKQRMLDFSNQKPSTTRANAVSNMEVDSTASTPAQD
ncbi:hypothetical protein HGRIS_008790 [Hohenbuehelia grisea]|uniref:Mediator of RNA polymerase II transcription subunit 9 n=1 Tax=Hohenbuehelia grisea TaxID=104357 RepID=A0ABR3J9B4_9AGAR